MSVVFRIEERQVERVSDVYDERARHEAIDLLAVEHSTPGEVVRKERIGSRQLRCEQRHCGDREGSHTGQIVRGGVARGEADRDGEAAERSHGINLRDLVPTGRGSRTYALNAAAGGRVAPRCA